MRYRLMPTADQEEILRQHCAHARFVWNLAVEQHAWWRPGRKAAPGWIEQCRQLTEARAEFDWLRAGSQAVQQQALRDFGQAMAHFVSHVSGRPRWRKAGRDEGFRQVKVKPEHVRRLSRHCGEVWVPKVGWVRFRWSRPVSADAKSYRVTLDRAGRWHIAFAVLPAPVPAPGNGSVVGVDRGVAVAVALSDGSMYAAPQERGVIRLQRRLARCGRGSNRRQQLKKRLARLHSRNTDARKDWAEKTSTDLARRFDLIRVEDLRIEGMTRSARGTLAEPGRNVRSKAGLNREILRSGWGLLVRRLETKAPGRVERVDPRFTSQRCSACGRTASESRESQALFRCVACNFTLNADVNAAINIAAGHAVTARGGVRVTGPANREPTARPLVAAGIPGPAREDAKTCTQEVVSFRSEQQGYSA